MMGAPTKPTKKEIMDAWLNMRDLTSDKAQWPLDNFSVHRFGAYGVTRSSKSEGACGPKPGEPTWIDNPQDTKQVNDAMRIKAQRWPCKHWGADLSAPAGTEVYAPKDGWVLYHGPASDAPFRGYGPWVMLIAHRDSGDSMWTRGWRWATGPLLSIFDFPEGLVSASYSLIGHLAAPAGTGAVRIPLPRDFWSSVGGKADHWSKLTFGGRGMLTDADAHDDDTVYPNVERSGVTIGRRIHAGDLIGRVSDANHIHWEVRNAPVAPGGPPSLTLAGRFDPIVYFKDNYNLQLPGGVTLPARSGGGAGVLLLLAALAFGKKKRGRR